MFSAPVCLAASRARRGVANYGNRCPSASNMMRSNRVVLDPDQQVQQWLAMFFREFERIGAAMGVVKYFRKQKLQFPRAGASWRAQGATALGPPDPSLALKLLKNPRYAGCYVHGQSRMRRMPDGNVSFAACLRINGTRFCPKPIQVTSPGNSIKAIVDACCKTPWRTVAAASGAILRAKAQRRSRGWPFAVSVARLDPALPPLQGKPSCDVYVSTRWDRERGAILSVCTGREIDREIGNILLGMIEPATLELSLAVQQELQGRLGEPDRLRKQQVERVRYEADLARQRFMNVDPNNRLVASTLEAEWNERLRPLRM